MTLDDLSRELSVCRKCAEAGYFIGSTPIFSGHPGAVFMTVGQAPGRHEAEVTHKPFSGPAGKRLFRWLKEAGFDEAQFRATQAMTAITKCYPGPNPSGRGDRVATRTEQALCAPWLEQELATIDPVVLILVGGLAIGRFLGNQRPMTELVGELFESEPVLLSDHPELGEGSRTSSPHGPGIPVRERDGRILVSLPHPSGASQWFNVPENKARLARALAILAELRAHLLT